MTDKRVQDMPKNQYIRDTIQSFERDNYPNQRIVQSGQTIQAVIDSCPVAEGSLKEGFTNSYVVRVPPDHEKEFYSLVRNAADDASDKRNVKVIYEDNPEGKFIVDDWIDCESLDNWTATIGTLSLDSDHNTTGEHCLKLEGTNGTAEYACDIDMRKYQGLLIDISSHETSETLRLAIFGGVGNECRTRLIIHTNSGIGGFKKTIFIPFAPSDDYPSMDPEGWANVYKFRVRSRAGNVALYFDNIKLVRTFPTNVALLHYDNSFDEHWGFIKEIEDRGWKAGFLTISNDVSTTADCITIENLQNLSLNGHCFVNHTISDTRFEHLTKSESHNHILQAHNFMCLAGLNKGIGLVCGKGGSWAIDADEPLRMINSDLIAKGVSNFPMFMADTGYGNADYTRSNLFLAAKRGGICSFHFHTITDITHYRTFLDYIETNFSHVLLSSDIPSYFPKEMVNTFKGTTEIMDAREVKTLSGNETIKAWDGETFFIDPAGGNRLVTPIGTVIPFQLNAKITIVNTADAIETLTFDPTFTAAGNHDAVASDIVMTDSGESWIVGHLVGKIINNTPDGSSGTITANTATTITAVLYGGTSNDWQNGEAYTITPAGLNQAIGQDQRATFVYDGEGWDIINLYDKTP